MVNQVLNYHDAQLYDTDVALFQSNQWLNDNTINFYFQYIYHTLCLPNRDGNQVLLMDPAIVSCMMLQCEDDDEYADLGRGLDLISKRIYFIPVNDNESFYGDCSHWSLLVFHASDGRFEHYDSSSGHNKGAAERISMTFSKLLIASGVPNISKWSSEAFVNIEDAPQQRNGYDCGIYVILVAEFLCCKHLALQNNLLSIQDVVTPQAASKKRRDIVKVIHALQV